MNLQRWDIWAHGAVERDMEDDGEFVYADEAIAALAKKDARIKELEGALALAYFGVRELQSQFEFCDCGDDPQDDICIRCITGKIMMDISVCKTLEDKE